MKKLLKSILLAIPLIKDWYDFSSSITNKVTIKQFIRFRCECRERVKYCYWPIHPNSEVTHPNNIYVGTNSNAATRPGCYLQGNGGIWIGDYVHFASNIGIISANHNLNNQMKHEGKEVRIGDYSWIGMNVVILPGVELGPRTIVGAGSVVTKSFQDGFCVIGGNPARLIKKLDKGTFVPTKFRTEYYGYVAKEKFVAYAKKNLKGHKYYDQIVQKQQNK